MAEEPEERWRADAEARLASLAKPPGALGTLEDWCVTLCVAQKTLRPTVSAVALVFCGDHGCKKADAALSPYPASATKAIFRSLATGVSCAAVLARSVGATLFMGRGTARRPVEAPAPAPSYGAMVGNQGVPEPRPVDEDADGGVFADY